MSFLATSCRSRASSWPSPPLSRQNSGLILHQGHQPSPLKDSEQEQLPRSPSQSLSAMSSPTDISSSSPASSLPLTVGKYAFLLADADLADCNLNLVPVSSARLTGNSSSATTAPYVGGEGDTNFAEEIKPLTLEDGSDGSVTLPCHAIVLCANSAYFRSKLLGGHTNPAVRGKREVNEAADLKDIPAIKALVRFMYTEVLEFNHGVNSPAELISILRVAGRFRVDDCIEACRREFRKLRSDEIDLGTIVEAYVQPHCSDCYSMLAPDSDASSPLPLDEAMSSVLQARLLALLGDGVAVLRSPETLLQSFLSLPLAAVVALLSSHQLVVDSENTVAVLASVWAVRSPQGPSMTAQQRFTLASCIRLPLLTPSFLCGVIPNLKWVSFTSAAAVSDGSPAVLPGSPAVPSLLVTSYFQAVQVRLASPESQAILQASASSKPISSSSLLHGKPRVAVKDQTLELMLEVEEARLERYLGDALEQLAGLSAGTLDGGLVGKAASGGLRGIQVNSETTFFCGYNFGIKLVFGATSGVPPAATVAADLQSPLGARPALSRSGSLINGITTPLSAAMESTFGVTPSVFASYPPGEEALLPLSAGPINVSFKCTLEAIGPYGTPWAVAKFTGGSFMRPGDDASVSSVGISSFFKKLSGSGGSVADPAAWRPFLADGKLKLRLTVVGSSVE